MRSWFARDRHIGVVGVVAFPAVDAQACRGLAESLRHFVEDDSHGSRTRHRGSVSAFFVFILAVGVDVAYDRQHAEIGASERHLSSFAVGSYPDLLIGGWIAYNLNVFSGSGSRFPYHFA